MTGNTINAKAKELKEALAKETGVRLEDVEKIMDRLGLDSALAHRESCAKTAERYKLPVSHGPGNVTLANTRIAVGDVSV